MPAPLASEALRAGPGRHPVHLTACASMRMRATVRRRAWVPCLRPTARCAAGLHGMTLEKERHAGAARKRSLASGTRPAPSPLQPLALRCACARQSGAVHGSRAFGPGALRRRPARDDVGEGTSCRRRSQAKPCERDQAGTHAPRYLLLRGSGRNRRRSVCRTVRGPRPSPASALQAPAAPDDAASASLPLKPRSA